METTILHNNPLFQSNKKKNSVNIEINERNNQQNNRKSFSINNSNISLFSENNEFNNYSIEDQLKIIKENEHKNILLNHFQNIHYNDEQLKFIESDFKSPCKLIGIPGGGKTQSIVGKILHHYINNEITNDNEFLILSYSRRACKDFIEKSKNHHPYIFHKNNVRTLHSIAGRVVYRNNLKKYENTNFDKFSSSQDTVIITAILQLDEEPSIIQDLDELKNCKIIFVDESQDLSNVQYEFIQCLSYHLNCNVIMIGDPNQNIYQFQKGSDEYLINHPGETYYLTKNYRSTPDIIQFINYFRPWNQQTPQMISMKSNIDEINKKPILFCSSSDHIIQNIIDEIKKSKFKKENIAIIGPVKKSRPYGENSYTNIGLSLFLNKLTQNNISFKKHYEDGNNIAEDVELDFIKEEGHINIITIHGSKGLEFDQVFLINFHTNTFGILPSQEKYREFKYLWYVGLSRAKYSLHIYIDKKKTPWYELKNCPNNLYQLITDPPIYKEIEFQEEYTPQIFNILDLMTNKKYMDDTVIYQFDQLLQHEITKEQMYEIDIDIKKYKIKNQNQYVRLNRIFIENLFQYFYSIKNNIIPEFLIKIQKILDCYVLIPRQYLLGYKSLKKKYGSYIQDLFTLSKLQNVKNKFTRNEEELYEYLCQIVENNLQKEIFIECENDVTTFPKNKLEDSALYLYVNKDNIDFIEKKGIFEDNNNYNHQIQIIINSLFDITKIIYQSLSEDNNIWNIDFKDELNDLKPFLIKIIDFALNMNHQQILEFNKQVQHPNLPLLCDIDIVINNHKIILLKFTKNINHKQIIQAILYSHILNYGWNYKPEIEMWNFYTGERIIIHFQPTPDIFYNVLKLISKSMKMKLQNMIFIYQLLVIEATKFGEMSFIIDRNIQEFSSKKYVSNGLIYNNCMINIPKDIQDISKITNERLITEGDSIETLKNDINNIINECENPIFVSTCNDTDKLLFKDFGLLKNTNDVIFVDLMKIIKMISQNRFGDMDLCDIYYTIFGNYYPFENIEDEINCMKEILNHFQIDRNILLHYCK